MIRIFFENWIWNRFGFYPIRIEGRSLNIMIEKIARVAGVLPTEVRVYFVENRNLVYLYNIPGPKTDGVLAKVEGYMEKTLLSKDNIVEAIQEFLASIGLDKEAEIIIHRYPSEISSFYDNGTFVSYLS